MTAFVRLIPRPRATYDVTHDGNIIVESSISPELHAARQLLTRGITGPCVTVGPDGMQRLRFDIAAMAASADRVSRYTDSHGIENASATPSETTGMGIAS